MDYDEMRRIYRLEKNTSRLVQLDDSFYNTLNEFVLKEKKEYMDSLKDMGNTRAKEFLNLKKMIEELFGLRQKKILNSALVAVRTGESSTDGMALQEKELYSRIFSALRNHQDLFDGIFAGEQASGDGERKALSFVSVRLLKAVPGFVGADMKEYGPYTENECVSLSYKVAKLLISKSLAELAEPE